MTLAAALVPFGSAADTIGADGAAGWNVMSAAAATKLRAAARRRGPEKRNGTPSYLRIAMSAMAVG
jgi:hypothetical protein